MTRVEAIEKEIEQLRPEELAQLRSWFVDYDADVWDEQIESDAKAGKLDSLAAKALAEYKGGKLKQI